MKFDKQHVGRTLVSRTGFRDARRKGPTLTKTRFIAASCVALSAAACSGEGGTAKGGIETASVQQALTPNDPQFGAQWGLRNVGQAVPWQVSDDATEPVQGVAGVDINMPSAWDLTLGSSAVLVGVVERSDIDADHEDLAGQLWLNPNEDFDGVDDDGNGCVDDVWGCNFKTGQGVGLGTPVDHGTHVAGIIGAALSNGSGIAGVAPHVKLVPLIADAEANTFLQAIAYAESIGVRIINLSQGSTSNTAFENPAVRDAMESADILFLCSGGNAGTPRLNFPSSFDLPNVLSVANLTNTGELSETSSYAPDHVDIAAPGRSVLSTVADGGYDYRDGTSMAAPHVAGVAALIMSQFPGLSVTQVAERIVRTRMRIVALDGLVRSGGMLDATAALQDVNSAELLASSTPGSITLDWNAGGTSYDVERDGTVVATAVTPPFVDSGLAVDSGHVYRVRSLADGSWSHRLMAKATQMPTSEAFVVESPHPYAAGFSQSYTITKPGATRLRVHFEQLRSVRGDVVDYLRLFDNPDLDSADANLSGQYPGGFWTHWVDGDTFSFTFSSNTGGDYGFRVDRIEYFGAAPTGNQDPVVVNPIADMVLEYGSPAFEIDLNAVFQDPDGDALNYIREPSDDDNTVVQFSSPTSFIVDPHMVGTVTNLVMARDGNGGEATLQFTTTVLPPASLTIEVQAEDQDFYRAHAETEHSGYTGTAYVNTDNYSGAKLQFTQAIPQAANYLAKVRFANGSSNRPARVVVNGQTVIASLDFGGTGAWNQWQEKSFVVSLPVDDEVDIRLETLTSSGLANIDKLTLVRQ